MKITLAENIRAFRKERGLTQEQLAEVLGVTAGAVYKWESGLSVPELGMLVEMADFFDISMDVLLGYRIKDNHLESILQRMNAYCKSKDPEALAEAEKALKKYPHSFSVVHSCAGAYLAIGAGSADAAKPRRALELLEQARLLIGQNTDPAISELTIIGEMADAYVLLGEQEKGVELLKRHNAERIFSHSIGTGLAVFLNRPAQAEPFLSEALLQSIPVVADIVTGYAFVFCSRSDYASAQDVLIWGLSFFRGLKSGDKPSFLDKTCADLLVLLAHVQSEAGRTEDARMSLMDAAALARRFDAAPDYGASALRFTALPESVSVHDSLAATAKESALAMLRLCGDGKLIDVWKEITQ